MIRRKKTKAGSRPPIQGEAQRSDVTVESWSRLIITHSDLDHLKGVGDVLRVPHHGRGVAWTWVCASTSMLQ